MRAVYLNENLESNDVIILKDGPFHHLKNVCRVKLGDGVLLINGKGLKVFSEVVELNKRDIKLILKKRIHDKFEEKKALVCLVKKDALELIVRQSVEVGITDLKIVKSARSQNYKVNESRLEQIITSAMEQSNFSYRLNLNFVDFETTLADFSEQIICFSTEVNDNEFDKSLIKNRIPLIGPEGGFSADELSQLKKKNVPFLKLNTPIQRAETAFLYAHGMLGAL
tara:strand:+ start:1586 stop:2260 length:675 start_codon:yes stop_codon:yes gene_type:complete